MFAAASVAILVSMLLALIRAMIGPSIYDRILAVNMFGTKTVLLIAILGYLMGRPEFLDIAIVYALINFISIIAVLRFFEYTHSPVDPSSPQAANIQNDNNLKETPSVDASGDGAQS